MSFDKQLVGKVAIVTGGGRGLGADISKSLASHGASVVVNYSSSAEKANAVVSSIKEKSGQAVAVKADIGSEEGPKHLIDETVKAFGHVDIIVNNGGLWIVEPLGSISTQSFESSFNVNVRGALLLVQAAIPHLRDNGRIINISSIASRAGYPGMSVYAGTKGAIESMSRAWAIELGPTKNITSNCVNCGPIMTDMIADVVEGVKPMTTNAPLPRIAETSDITDIIDFLAGPKSHWITGDVISASGGIVQM
ncbi:hypothetical protein BGW37DRAFT_507138 [Umbelopsis sp. PMI_123]|nr:hypothetical protein BGW37DRAFT_507138 [Umbelopsis sp. PMI_123]